MVVAAAGTFPSLLPLVSRVLTCRLVDGELLRENSADLVEGWQGDAIAVELLLHHGHLFGCTKRNSN